MALISSFNEDRPVSYFRGYPIYWATILTVTYALGIVATFLAKAFGSWDLVFSLLAFDSSRSILGGQIWQIVTYSFVDIPSFFTILGLLFLYFSAVEIEKYIGKTRFLTLYSIILLIPVVTLTLLGLLVNAPILYFGQTQVMIGLFIAFCTLYPGLQWGGFLTAKWVAIGSLAISSLVDLSSSAWISLGELWLISGFSFAYIRFLQRGGEFPAFRFAVSKRPNLRVVSKPKPRSRAATPSAGEGSTADIDHLLEKISKSGLGSLTAQERDALQRAREKLLRKDKN
jgi:membrane associated rhomboid family serine protease